MNKAFRIKGKAKGWNPVYIDSLLKYSKCLGPLFEKTKNKSEFEFVCTLLRVRGSQDAGWDPWNTSSMIFDSLTRLANRIRDFRTRRHLFLWLYGHIIEASEPYEIVANLISIIEGGRFNANNFPDIQRGKYKRPQSPSEKINKLVKMANKIGMSGSIFPFEDVFDRELRNAIFHSDYALYGGEVRLPKGCRKVFSHSEIEALINKALAHINVFKNLISGYIRTYQSPRIIPAHPEFSKVPQEQVVTIVRKGYGLVGLKDNWSIDELKRGRIPIRIGRFLTYERNMLDKDPTLAVLPRNRIERANKILRILPKFLSRKIVKITEKHKYFEQA